MPTLHHLFGYIKNYGFRHKAIYALALMILFWSIFDGIISYIAPILIVQNGISKSEMGLLLASSSFAGAIFDFLLCRLFKNSFYRRIFIAMFALSFVYPLLLLEAKTLFVYLIAMALWGVFYDLRSVGTFDFIGRHSRKADHSSDFGLVQVFQSLGYLFAPILVGAVVGEVVDWKPAIMCWISLSISFFFFAMLLGLEKKHSVSANCESMYCEKPKNLSKEFKLWGRLGKLIFPVLLLTMFLYIVDAFFWTVGPLYAESNNAIKEYAGLFMAAYTLPPLLVGWFVGALTRRFGQKRTALIGLLSGSLVLSVIGALVNPYLIVIVVFVASMCFSVAWPAINGVYADYISEAEEIEKEIAGLEDFYMNIGFALGHIIAGFFADFFGNAGAFTALGLIGAMTALILFRITPRNIDIRKSVLKSSEI